MFVTSIGYYSQVLGGQIVLDLVIHLGTRTPITYIKFYYAADALIDFGTGLKQLPQRLIDSPSFQIELSEQVDIGADQIIEGAA